MADEQPRLMLRDPKVMRALAHPARLAIMEYLMAGSSATATECAEIVGLSPSATSYHLRALERFGLVSEAPSRGDGRERLWQSAVRGMELDSDTVEPETLEAQRDLVTVVLDRQEQQTREYMARLQDEPAEWRDATVLTTGTMRLTIDEAAQLTQAVLAILKPYGEAIREEVPEDSRRVRMIFRLFPAI